MRAPDRFDRCGVIVRLIFGRKPQVYLLPGVVEPRVWDIHHGVAIKNQSMSDALALAAKISGREAI